jgi:hypothetical protein
MNEGDKVGTDEIQRNELILTRFPSFNSLCGLSFSEGDQIDEFEILVFVRGILLWSSLGFCMVLYGVEGYVTATLRVNGRMDGCCRTAFA